MGPAIKLIVDNATEYPSFRYYIRLMKKAEHNMLAQPDICIEICKALIEGVSKSVILDFHPDTEQKKLNNMDVAPLAKWACQLLRQDNTVIEDELVRRVASVAEFLGVLRNERGDVSHGRQVPKPVQSDDKLAAVIFQISSGVLTYMLDSFFAAKRLSRAEVLLATTTEPTPPESESSPDLEEVAYEGQEDFNIWLDEQYPYEGKLTYSFALYSLYYEDYLIRLGNYQESLQGDNA
jgi:hypothetical protein